ncbi:hypothetical protein Lalb_Chr23g0274971 [Lupinus albus]|uniref:Uncharacterized protein n=1 Tax=Lupinus albus TaxID=3870 RepID=A0A6A4NLW8_LUPAL|nr:hypothetical protein Lalb_Chr23g0274971 [Lupinus albus]
MYSRVLGPTFFLVHPTVIDQGREVHNLLMPKYHLQLWSQTNLKLCTLGPPVRIHFIVRAILCQLIEVRNVLSHRHIPLLQSQEFNLPFPLQISRKVLLEESSLERFSSNCSSFYLHLSPGVLPPVLCFLRQHVGSISRLLIILTTHLSENLLQILNPFICSNRSESPLELTRFASAEFIQSTILR